MLDFAERPTRMVDANDDTVIGVPRQSLEAEECGVPGEAGNDGSGALPPAMQIVIPERGHVSGDRVDIPVPPCRFLGKRPAFGEAVIDDQQRDFVRRGSG